MQNVECRMQNEEGTAEIFRNRCHRQGAEAGSSEPKRSALAVTTIDESCDSYRSYNTNLGRGSGISAISGEKSHPFCRRNRGKYALHMICSVIYSERSELDVCAGPQSGNRKSLFGYVRICSFLRKKMCVSNVECGMQNEGRSSKRWQRHWHSGVQAPEKHQAPNSKLQGLETSNIELAALEANRTPNIEGEVQGRERRARSDAPYHRGLRARSKTLERLAWRMLLRLAVLPLHSRAPVLSDCVRPERKGRRKHAE